MSGKRSKHTCDYCGEPFQYPGTVFSLHTVELNSRDVPEVVALKKFVCPLCVAVAFTRLLEHLEKYPNPAPPNQLRVGDVPERLV